MNQTKITPAHSQCTDTLLMIRPIKFRYNEQTAINNYYMNRVNGLTEQELSIEARNEFDTYVNLLRSKGMIVVDIDDKAEPDTPDSIFPNNWISFHQDGRAAVYPMYAPNRRLERRTDIFTELESKHGFMAAEVVDFSYYEQQGKFMEGTGSATLDRTNKIAYAALSERTDKGVFEDFCREFGYKPVSFIARQDVEGERLPIYHTNVLMCVGDGFVVICLEAIDDPVEYKMLMDQFAATNQEVVAITEEQKHQFAGNMLHIQSTEGQKFVAMSTSAFNSLRNDQIEALSKYGEIIHSPIGTIESLGGGSARCMMAEVFLPKKMTSVVDN